jgi:hypothetical protein
MGVGCRPSEIRLSITHTAGSHCSCGAGWTPTRVVELGRPTEQPSRQLPQTDFPVALALSWLGVIPVLCACPCPPWRWIVGDTVLRPARCVVLAADRWDSVGSPYPATCLNSGTGEDGQAWCPPRTLLFIPFSTPGFPLSAIKAPCCRLLPTNSGAAHTRRPGSSFRLLGSSIDLPPPAGFSSI